MMREVHLVTARVLPGAMASPSLRTQEARQGGASVQRTGKSKCNLVLNLGRDRDRDVVGSRSGEPARVNGVLPAPPLSNPPFSGTYILYLWMYCTHLLETRFLKYHSVPHPQSSSPPSLKLPGYRI